MNYLANSTSIDDKYFGLISEMFYLLQARVLGCLRSEFINEDKWTSAFLEIHTSMSELERKTFNAPKFSQDLLDLTSFCNRLTQHATPAETRLSQSMRISTSKPKTPSFSNNLSDIDSFQSNSTKQRGTSVPQKKRRYEPMMIYMQPATRNDLTLRPRTRGQTRGYHSKISSSTRNRSATNDYFSKLISTQLQFLMSIITSTPEQICRAPINTSKSKQQYSFSKSERFPSVKLNNESKTFFYETNRPTTSTRATNFGIGERSDFTKGKTVCPAPDRYNVVKGIGTTHVITFGVSREVSARRFLKNHPPHDRSIPGPASYNVPPKFQKDSLSFTIRPKTRAESSTYDASHTPGPGAYNESQTLNPQGKYSSSKRANPAQMSFAPKSSARFYATNSRKDNPGPGHYQPKTELTNTGQYFVSALKSSRSTMFGRQIRPQMSTPRLNTPGPGSYRQHSDFGQYENKRGSQTSRDP